MHSEKAERVGMSGAGFDRIASAIQGKIDRGEIPGAVVAVGRRGEQILFEAFGFRDPDTRSAMTRNSIFRIFGMTKTLVSLVAMILVEQNRLSLASPASEYLPALENLKVGVEKPDGELELVELQREPTVLDLMRHTSGFIYGLGTSAVRRVYRAANLDSIGDGADYIAKLATLPLQFQPGTRWAYGSSTDVLGHIIEAITGEPLDTFIAATVTVPLRVPDTAYWVADAADHHRMAESLRDPATGNRILSADKTKRPRRISGGSGMVSTAADLERLCRLFLGGGELDGTRLISRKSVELMTTDQLPPRCEADPDVARWLGPASAVEANGMGWGLGFFVRTHAGRTAWHGSVGDYGAMGLGSMFWIDPREQLYAIIMAQTTMTETMRLTGLMRSLVYQAIID